MGGWERGRVCKSKRKEGIVDHVWRKEGRVHKRRNRRSINIEMGLGIGNCTLLSTSYFVIVLLCQHTLSTSPCAIVIFSKHSLLSLSFLGTLSVSILFCQHSLLPADFPINVLFYHYFKTSKDQD